MVQRVAVVGTGLIGGSIALGVRAAGSDVRVVGYDRNVASARRARQHGVVDEVAARPEDAVADADLIVLATPVDQIPELCARLAQAVGEKAVVTDVGSAKAAVVREGERAFGPRFVGGHPMTGSERHGVDAADPALFQGTWWILTPTEATSSDAYARVRALAGALGAHTVAVAPEVHDALIARLSHLPQLAASALVEVAVAAGDRDALLGLAAGGFRDVTRIAASSPDLWVAIIRSNAAAVLDALGGLQDRFHDLAEVISNERWGELRAFLDGARTARLELFAKPVPGGAPVALSLLVPDRPGVLSEVTTAAGDIGANIEDLRIVHSPEGGRGRLEVIVDRSRADDLAVALERLGYRVERGEE